MFDLTLPKPLQKWILSETNLTEIKLKNKLFIFGYIHMEKYVSSLCVFQVSDILKHEHSFN